jgi:Trk K+ transport system NAD-binding subunit
VVGNRHNNSKKRTRILIITSSIIENQDDIIEEYHGCELYFIHDDPSHHNVLKKYGALTAKSIILLADEQTQNPDEKNALIALAVKHLEDEDDEKNTTKHGVSKDIRVIAELSDNSRSAYLTNAGADEVIGKNYSAGIIAQTAIFKGMSLMFNNLLTYSNNTNEIYFIGSDNYPENWQGQTFDELSDTIAKYYSTQANKVAVRCQCPNVASEACNKRKKCYKNSNCKINNCSLIKREKKPLLLLGIKLSDKNSHSTALSERIVLNPIREKFDKLSQGDALIIMSYNSIDKLKE